MGARLFRAPSPRAWRAVSFNPRSIRALGKESQEVASQVELAADLEQQMNGHAWSMSLTYVWPMRAGFLIFFDAQGRVQSVSGIAGPG